ncbi:prolipoprotein diacylglyceryl transferase [Dehalobacter restrictus]|uniref:prolipoprotein diacylglyceryl transferase n=1 Tax=Dehalobacter restrictus TaxID=55583 RepID=UPI00338DF07C
MNPIVFNLGPIAIHWYGVLIAVAFGIGIILANSHAALRKIDTETLTNLLFIVIPAALIGARLYYVLFNLAYYTANPYEILAVWHGGLAIHGGIIGGFLAGYWYIRKEKNLNLWSAADVIAPSLILGQAIGRWGNFFNQEAHGGPVSYEFISRFPHFIQQGMYIDGQYYHPTFLYESLWDSIVFFILFWLIRRKRLPDGVVVLIYFILYSVGRFLVEGLRTDSLMLGPFRIAQVVSIGVIFLSGIILYLKLRNFKLVSRD